MKYYSKASEEENQLLAEAMRLWHGNLVKHDVRIGFIMAYSSSDAPAVTHGGYSALATIRIVSGKDRLSKGYDAELLVCGATFGHLSSMGRMALLDHELRHLALHYDKKTGQVKKDDLNRPKLKTRKGDWNAGDGFKSVCARHGEHAIEFENLRLAFGRAQEAAQKGGSA